MTLKLPASIVALVLAASANAEQHSFTHSGKLTVDANMERTATLNVACSPDPNGGALSIELVVPEANTRKDFDYDDFEGPDAAAGARALSHVAWKTAADTTDITHAAAGSYLPQPPESFMFGIDQLSRRHGQAASMLAAVGAEPGQMVWTQTGFDDSKRKLIATFTLDAAATQHLHDTAAPCLSDRQSGRK